MILNRYRFRYFLIASLCFPLSVSAQQEGGSVLSDAAEIRKALGVSPAYDEVQGLSDVVVAILDNGFQGMGPDQRYLPDSAEMIADYDKEFLKRNGFNAEDPSAPLDADDNHGRRMGQIVWGMTGNRQDGPKFYLLNSRTVKNLRRAVRWLVEFKEKKPKTPVIVVHSQTFPCCGDGKGGGPINKIINEATASGVLWMNAAGNYHNNVYAGPVTLDRQGYVQFQARNGESVRQLKFQSEGDETEATITLAWDPISDDPDQGTEADLDLYVVGPDGKQIAKSEKIQVVRLPENKDERTGKDTVPRERVKVKLQESRGKDSFYRIEVKAKPGSEKRFNSSNHVWITIEPAEEPFPDRRTGQLKGRIRLIDAIGRNEIMTPADNPNVFTVGDLSPVSSVGPTLDNRQKPDVVIPRSEAFFSDLKGGAGTSNGAAYLAGVVALLAAKEPEITLKDLTKFKQSPLRWVYDGYPVAIRAVIDAVGEKKDIRIGSGMGGRLVVEMPQSPAAYDSLFPTFPFEQYRDRLSEFEYYLKEPAQGQNQGQGRNNASAKGYYRSTQKGRDGKAMIYPWEHYRDSPESYIELVSRRAPGERDIRWITQPIWKTPSPKELRDSLRNIR